MYYNIFVERDATIYEKYPEQNTGIDQILELTKIASGSIFDGFYQSNTYNSRILIDFGSQISEISNSIDQGEIPTISEGTRFYLNLRATNAESLPISYSLMAYPVSESWVNGNGNGFMEIVVEMGLWNSNSNVFMEMIIVMCMGKVIIIGSWKW